MLPADRTRLLHMIEAGETALAFIAGRRREDLDTDRLLLFAPSKSWAKRHPACPKMPAGSCRRCPGGNSSPCATA